MSSTDVQQRPTQQRPTEVARRDPFEDLEHLWEQLAQVFPSWPRVAGQRGPGAGMDAEFIPLADVEETEDAYLIEMELPGVDKKDINVELSGRRLTVTGQRKEKERVGTVRRRTRMVGRFRYEILLPGSIDEQTVDAQLKDGVLTVRIPKTKAERAKQISVK